MKKKKRIIKRKRQQSNRKIIGIVCFACLAATLTLTYYTFSGNDTMKLSNSSESERLGRALGILLKAMASKSQNSGTPVSQERSSDSCGTPISSERPDTHSSLGSFTSLNERIMVIQELLAKKALKANEYEMDVVQRVNDEKIRIARKKAENGREKRLLAKLEYTLKRVNEGAVSHEDMVNHVYKDHVITGYDYALKGKDAGKKVYAWAEPKNLY